MPPLPWPDDLAETFRTLYCGSWVGSTLFKGQAGLIAAVPTFGPNV